MDWINSVSNMDNTIYDIWVVCQKSKFVHYYLFLSVLVFWHKANSACF